VELKIDGLCPLLQVFDMPTSLAFYRDVLGFTVVTRAPDKDDCDWALLRLNDSHLMLNSAYESDDRPAIPDPARIAAHRDTGLFFGCRDVDGAYAYLREKGIGASKPAVQSYGMKQVYLKDPDGYELCLQCPA
jgi:catechol 2,3-dioxygenase-like lactoylglutathione lyase family enzyme